MAKADLGTKRICPQCGTRYYDMKKKPPVCPKCGALYDPEHLVKSRRGRSADKKADTPKPEELEDLPIDDSDDEVFEDADELADEDVDIDVADDDKDERI